MSKINVYSSSASYAIKVFDTNSTGLKPYNAILVTTGTEPSNAIQINIGDKKWSSIAVNFGGDSPVPPGPGPSPSLPPYTIRLKFKQGTNPSTFEKGTGVLVDAEQNIWDLTYENSNWSSLLQRQKNLIEVIEANTTGVVNMEAMFLYCGSLETMPLFNTSNVTNMQSMFTGCTSLTTIPLFDTSNVTNMAYMFNRCSSLTSVPLFNTSKVTIMEGMFIYCGSLTSVPLFNTSKVLNMYRAFANCFNVQSGALALYQQVSTQTTPSTNHTQTFYNCGRDTQTGAAELAQIPDDWK